LGGRHGKTENSEKERSSWSWMEGGGSFDLRKNSCPKGLKEDKGGRLPPMFTIGEKPNPMQGDKPFRCPNEAYARPNYPHTTHTKHPKTTHSKKTRKTNQKKKKNHPKNTQNSKKNPPPPQRTTPHHKNKKKPKQPKDTLGPTRRKFRK